MRAVLVTQRLGEAAGYPEVREGLDVRWGKVFRALDLLPVPMAQEVAPETYAALRPAGVVLTGGNDLACCSDAPLSRRRDAYERRVLRAAGTHDWPIFAVCRGLQLLAVEAGGKLATVDGHVATDHALDVVPGAPFGALLGEVRSVNSFHRYAPAPTLAPGWTVCARGGDGSVEAIAHHSRRALGIMWHPERYETVRPCDLALLRAVLG